MKQGKMKRGGAAPALCVAAAMAVSMLASAVAVAQTNDGAPAAAMQAPVANTEIGHSTLAWLDLQRSNTQAAPALPMLGAEAGLAYRRYMESFKSKIPDLYGSALKAGGSGDAGGGSGGALGSGGSGAN